MSEGSMVLRAPTGNVPLMEVVSARASWGPRA